SWTTPINLPGAVSASIDMSMAITASSTAGSPGVLHVSYEGSAGNLRYYSCDITSTGTNCAAAASWGAGFVNIPAVSPDGTWISLKAGPSSTGGALGRLHLVFRNNGTTLFSYTTCDLTTNTDCRTAANWNAFVAVDAAANANQRISLGIDGGGVLHVSYTDSTAQDLKYATCSPGGGTTCTVAANWTLVCLEGSTTGCSSPIRSNWNLDGYSSLAVDSFGEVAIAYHDNTAATTGNTGLRLRLAASLGGQAAGPVVAMDVGGNAIAGFVRPMLTGCPALPKRDTSVVAGSDDPDNNGLNSELSHAGCYASTPAVNKFTAATTSWLGTLDINPGSPTQAYSESTQTTADICFQEGDDSVGGGANDANLAGYNSACVNFSQLGISMERTTGNASVVMKLDWMEQENANGCSGSDAPADVGDAHGGGGGANNDDPASGQANQCPPSTVAWDEFNGDAITTMRYPATALWDGDNGAATAGAATTMTDGAKAWVVNQWTGSMVEIISGTGQGQRRSIVSNTATVLTITPNWTTNPAGGSTYKISAWGNTYLYAHSMQPTDAQLDNTTVVNVVSNCPVSGQYQESLGADGAGRILLNCKVNAPSIAMSGDASQTTLAVYERYDGTNYDIYADCFTLGGSTCGTTAIPGPTCADGNFNDGWRSVSCDTGATFRGNGFMPPPIVNTGTSEASSLATVTTPYLVLNNTAVSRTAFSPQAAMDSTGNGLAVWTERDGNQWRVYGMRFIAGFVGCTVGTDCGFITASRVPIDAFGADPSCASGTCMYSNPVLSMEWVNAGNAPSCPAGVNCGSAWTLMLDTELFGGALLPPILNVRVQAHQWTPP
ncbi:MAG: hypothetical protein HY349_02920, partial [Nitrospirae bacterium]|nr:hypothetical protein [Nitrospirota bacterium]